MTPLPLTTGLSVVDLVRRRWQGTYEVDAFGLDPDLVALAAPLADIRWHLVVRNAAHIPAEGPVMLVCSRRIGLSEPFVVAAAVRREVGRQVRTIGTPDFDPVGPMLGRFGAVLPRPDEVAGLLANGEMVQVPLGNEVLRPGKAGPAPLELIAPAVSTGATVIPVAVVGRELGRRWKVIVGEPLASPSGPAALATGEMAEMARRGVQDLLSVEVSGFLPFL